MTIVYLTWIDIENDAAILANMLQSYSFSGLIIVPRGGLIPAALLMKSRHYNQIKIFNNSLVKEYGSDWLVVDEICDTGETIHNVRRRAGSQLQVAALYVKPIGKPYVDFWVREFEQETWVHMPWES